MGENEFVTAHKGLTPAIRCFCEEGVPAPHHNLPPSQDALDTPYGRLREERSDERYGNVPSHIQTVRIETAVAMSTAEAATRRARPYMLAKI